MKNQYPLLLISELLDHLGGSTIFSKINLTNGFNQRQIANKDIPKTTFRTKYGAYKTVVMNFGMTNAPSTFVTLMNNTFKPLLGKCVIIYLIDIIVFSKTKSQHKEDLKVVFLTLWENQLFAKPSQSASSIKRA